MLFLGTLFLCRAHVGSCFISTSSPYDFSRLRPVVVSLIVKPCASSIDISDGNTIDSYGDFHNDDDSWSTPSDWAKGNSSDFKVEYNAEVGEGTVQMSDEDIWIQDALDEIHNVFPTLNDHSVDEQSADDDNMEAFIDSEMDDEIAMLVRCNEEPESLLIEEGRAIAPLTTEEKNDVSQLVVFNKDEFEATKFFKDAVSNMFRKHATPSVLDEIFSMDRASVASWMTKSLKETGEGKVSSHDRRVLKTLSDFGTYGSGRLVEEQFQNLYLDAIVGDASNLSSVSVKRHMQLRTPFRDAVWRDIRGHGIKSPVEEERSNLIEKHRVRNSNLTVHGDSTTKKTDQMIVDECEILDWDYRAPELKRSKKSKKKNTRGSSSHKLVEMASDENTPLRIRDGEFVFIDEESCIGCTNCANIAPSTFSMEDSGRARTFFQRNSGDVEQAIDACPVSCMHHVSYQELSAFETARDERESRVDPKTFEKGYTPIPLHVAGMASDINRRSSEYHTLKHKCLMSSSCPQKGCYDCPFYQSPGENPFFIAKHKQAEHIRAEHFIESEEADIFRKSVDL